MFAFSARGNGIEWSFYGPPTPLTAALKLNSEQDQAISVYCQFYQSVSRNNNGTLRQ
jgi:hypothetical protein